MFDRSITLLSIGRMIRGGGSHRTSSSTSRIWGQGARSQPISPVLQAPRLGWYSVGVRRLEEALATGLACRGAHSRLLTRSSLPSPGGQGFEVGRCGRSVGRLMVRRSFLMAVSWVIVESRCSVLFVGMVVGGRGAPWCHRPVARRSRCDPFTPGWLGVGRLACGLFAVRLRLQLRCGWCAVVFAA